MVACSSAGCGTPESAQDAGEDVGSEDVSETEDPPGCEGNVEFVNAEQEAIVAGLLGLPEGSKVAGDLFASADLFFGNAGGLTSLVGFECATGIQHIYIHDNEIVDVSPIAEITLVTLGADNNKIVDLEPLRAHPTLFTLAVPNNPIASTAPIVDMPMLSNLVVDDTAPDLARGVDRLAQPVLAADRAYAGR